MFKNLSILLIGIYFFIGTFLIIRSPKPEGRVLSDQIEVTPTPTTTPTNSASPTPTPTTTATPTLVSVQITNKPTIKSTARPTSTATSTVQSSITPTPNSTAIPTPSPTPATTFLPTPTPTTTSVPVATFTAEQIYAFYNQYAGQYGVSADILRHIAQCESGFNPSRISPNGLYHGLFQFGVSAWTNYRRQMGQDTNPALRINAEEAIKTAAYVLKLNQAYIWPNCVPH